MSISHALERYLLTIYTITRSKSVAKVKDVAAALKVSSASVSPAMKRLESSGLVRYGRREYIELTTAGERVAETLQYRREALAAFFQRTLCLKAAEAARESNDLAYFISESLFSRVIDFVEEAQEKPRP